ncbi:DND1 protein, partial [Polyodon spathula]|nr:DND1 protein [Polyodon spathula]
QEFIFAVLNQESLANLETWAQKTGICLVQINGQRKYGGPPPGWTGFPPSSGCEVFINQIPRDVYEDRLIPLFQRAGMLYEFRLMMNFSGQNRGFAYAKYTDPESAEAAIRMFNRYELQNGCYITVRKSTEKRVLLLDELPRAVEKDMILLLLRNVTEGVEDLEIKPSPKGSEKASAAVQYVSHHAASMAKKDIVEEFKKYGMSITVQWFNQMGKPKTQNKKKLAMDTDPGFMKRSAEPGTRKNVKKPDTSSFLSLLHLQAEVPLSEGFVPPVLSGPSYCPVYQKPSSQDDDQQYTFNINQPSKEARLDAVTSFNQLCIHCRFGSPWYDMQLVHTGPDGYQYFSVKVFVPGLPLPFKGVVKILAGCLVTVQEEVKMAAASQILKALSVG